MIEELAQDYANYLKVDVSKELPAVEETIDDMLTRLEEFESLVRMVLTEGTVCVDISIPAILSHQDKMEKMFQRIDHLEQFIARVNFDMDVIESQVETAEAVIGNSEGRLKSLLKPLFFKKSSSESVTKKTPVYEAPDIFSSAEIFNENLEL